jgi:hypothetical protein
MADAIDDIQLRTLHMLATPRAGTTWTDGHEHANE